MKDYKHDLCGITAISKQALADFYVLRDRFQMILSNVQQDVNNPSQMDKTCDLVKDGVSICNKWINANPHMNPID